MAKRFLAVLTVASVVAVLTPLFVTTQAAEVRCQIPFSFTVNGKSLPAGTYTLSTSSDALVVRGYKHGAIVLSDRMESPTMTSPRAVFEKFGDEYVLREVWMGEGGGREIRARVNPDRREALGPVERVVIYAM